MSFIVAACLACGKFVLCFPEECRPFIEELFPLFIGNLEDSIPSVRQGAAAAIANIVKAYGMSTCYNYYVHVLYSIQ